MKFDLSIANLSIVKRLLFILICLSLFGCPQYDEGPSTLRTPIMSIPKGYWKIVSYTVDGIDSMQMIYDAHLEGRFSFSKYSTPGTAYFDIETIAKDTTYRFAGQWFERKIDGSRVYEMSMGYLKLYKSFGDPLQTVFKVSPDEVVRLLSGGGKHGLWEIVRLEHKEDLWLRAEKKGKLCELRFKSN